MKTSRILFPFLGALVGFGGSWLLVHNLDQPGFEWAGVVLKPGIAVAELVENATSSLALCIIAGFLTMALIGALIGFVIDLLISTADSK